MRQHEEVSRKITITESLIFVKVFSEFPLEVFLAKLGKNTPGITAQTDLVCCGEDFDPCIRLVYLGTVVFTH